MRTFAWRRLSVWIAAAGLAAACMASPSYAQVMEISHEGIVSVREGSGAATWQVVDASPALLQVGSVPTYVPADAITSIGRLNVPSRYADVVERAAAAAEISPALLAALVWQESRWDAGAVSPKGAMGLTQLMPGTARDLGVDPRDPNANLAGGARYLRQLLDTFQGDVVKALAAYNAGPGRVLKANGVPAIRETRAYVASVVQRVSSIRSRGEQ
jgi:soluble lytic murein transglycosylase-like protein